MKSFIQYLTESKKTYAFKVKVAGDLSEDFNDKLKGALEKFAVANMSKGKRSPIQEVPLDFPTMKNTNVTVYDLEISYPTTNDVLENYISQSVNHPLHCVKVVTANAPSEEYQAAMKQKADTKSLLQDSDLEAVDGQEMVGAKKISSFLKDLAAEAKSRACEGQPKEKAAEVSEESASKSPVGSQQNELPAAKTAAGLKGK